MMRLDAPNDLQPVVLATAVPSAENVRLFVERESLAALEEVYRQHAAGTQVVLPDAPILRWHAKAHPLEILAGERRVQAALNVGLVSLPCRIVRMSDDDAYRFIVAHNHVAGLTTAELAFRAAEMDRLGFTGAEISTALQGASTTRYVDVGAMIDPGWFTDEKKLCDPSIVEWHEAAQFGARHFTECFKAWNAGIWDEKQCAYEFRRRGHSLPLDNAERGFRVTYNENRLVVRGQVSLDYLDVETAWNMLEDLRILVRRGQERLIEFESFGAREIVQVQPTDLLPEV